MLLLTPHERRAIIFVGAAFFCGICLDIIGKLHPPVYATLKVLDTPAPRIKVDINKASYEQLVSVPGIGSSTAARIIYAREAKGRFTSLEELRKIKGFSRKSFDRALSGLMLGAP